LHLTEECIDMMGHQGGVQDKLFYSFNLDDHVPQDHLLRGIDRVFDLRDLRHHLTPFYSHTGRPSIDPELMMRMLIVGYCFGIRSERRLCEEVHLNLAYRWFCRLGLEDAVPIQPSPRIDTGVFAIATHCATSSRACCGAA
jgi:transposase